jgi:hypothetical protein
MLIFLEIEIRNYSLYEDSTNLQLASFQGGVGLISSVGKALWRTSKLYL